MWFSAIGFGCSLGVIIATTKVSSRMMWWMAVVVLVVAIMVGIQEVPIIVSTSETISTDYNIIELDAPAMSGQLLTLVTWFATRTPLRPFILRFLLNQNEVHLIRELAASKLVGVPPTYYPLARLSAIDYDYHVQAASALESNKILSQGLTSTFRGKYRTVMDYHRMYQSGRATPTQVMTNVLEGCRKLEHLHMFSSLLPDDVLQQAKESDARWKSGQPLSVFDGVPVGVKDMVRVQGHTLCYGSKWCSTDDSEDIIVARFRQAGAIILGVTVITEGGVTPLGYSLAFDGPFNPYNTDYYPGGSSAGSAVIVAVGLAPVAIGFDGGGSIRVPASMSGTFGLAATFGRIESDAALDLTVIKAGTLAASAADMALAHLCEHMRCLNIAMTAATSHIFHMFQLTF
jgi:Amidase